MDKEEAKGKNDKTAYNKFGSACKDFQGMFEKMKGCCSGKDNWIDCCEMMEGCCAPKGEGKKTND